jgi:BirA family biotin operon repressor/biotin-[acetyl-CoA-carboxylase] ligase
MLPLDIHVTRAGGTPTFTEHTVADAARSAGLAGEIRYVPSTGSTNSDLVAMAEGGAPAWSLLVAGHQLSGRGRLGRSWVANPGTSLLASVLLRPEMETSRAPLLSLGAAACVRDAVAAACGVETACKWPNDVMAGDRKLAGVLAESKVEAGRIVYVVIGVGVNVRQREKDFAPDLRGSATSVAVEGGRADGAPLLSALLGELRRNLDPSVAGFDSAVLQRYRARCQTVGRAVRATTADGRSVEGEAVGIGDRGELLVRGPAGVESVAFGEVAALRPGPSPP